MFHMVTRNNGLQVFSLASTLASETINADITVEKPLVNPNCRDDCLNVSESWN